jgi:prepilin-type N-terminal cleavage/methylation domain-containing protein
MLPTLRTDRWRRAPTGFTLMEMIVVIAVLALLVTMTAPRLIGQPQRALQLAADQVADLLTMFAQREALGQKPAGIWHDAGRNWIVLMILDIDETRPEDPADWRPDPFVTPVKLPPGVPANGVLGRADGESMDFRLWPIATAPGKERPAIEISLVGEDGATRTIVLPSHAVAPYQVESDTSLVGFRTPIDLDAAGRSREDW